jgi:hypothetical protein
MSVSAGKFLNVGCGRDVRTEPGWVNLDLPGNTALRPDLDIAGDVADRDSWYWVGSEDYPFFEEDEPPFDHIVASHVIEHVLPVAGGALAMMENLWHVSAAGTTIEIRCPHGASDDADEDPTHVRRMFPSSFHYFAQYAYWRPTTAIGPTGSSTSSSSSSASNGPRSTRRSVREVPPGPQRRHRDGRHHDRRQGRPARPNGSLGTSRSRSP